MECKIEWSCKVGVKSSPTGNWTRVSCVTDRNTNHYTIEDLYFSLLFALYKPIPSPHSQQIFKILRLLYNTGRLHPLISTFKYYAHDCKYPLHHPGHSILSIAQFVLVSNLEIRGEGRTKVHTGNISSFRIDNTLVYIISYSYTNLAGVNWYLHVLLHYIRLFPYISSPGWSRVLPTNFSDRILLWILTLIYILSSSFPNLVSLNLSRTIQSVYRCKRDLTVICRNKI